MYSYYAGKPRIAVAIWAGARPCESIQILIRMVAADVVWDLPLSLIFGLSAHKNIIRKVRSFRLPRAGVSDILRIERNLKVTRGIHPESKNMGVISLPLPHLRDR